MGQDKCRNVDNKIVMCAGRTGKEPKGQVVLCAAHRTYETNRAARELLEHAIWNVNLVMAAIEDDSRLIKAKDSLGQVYDDLGFDIDRLVKHGKLAH